MCKKYVVDRDPLTNKKDGKEIKKLNTMQRMHEGLYHQDVVGLEQEYADKLTQYNEREAKVPKVDLQPIKLPTQSIEPSGNTLPTVNEEPNVNANNDVPGVNEVDQLAGMHPTALEPLIKKQSDPYPHYMVFRKGTKSFMENSLPR